MPAEKKKHLIVLCGPTGIGKSMMAARLAVAFGCEIISADSRQLFREMSIGTAVPGREILNAVPHHFIHSHSIHDDYNASKYEMEVLTFLSRYFVRNKMIIMVGGSGLYIDAVLKGIDDLPSVDRQLRNKWMTLFDTHGLDFIRNKVKSIDPDYYAAADINNPKRLLKAIEVYETTGKPYSSFLKKAPRKRDFSVIKVGLNTDRKTLYAAIDRRVDEMISKGLIEEAGELYPWRHLTPLNTVGYKELFAGFEGKLTIEEATGQIRNHTHAYARRQLTWFRRDDEIKWFKPDDIEQVKQYISSRLQSDEKKKAAYF